MKSGFEAKVFWMPVSVASKPGTVPSTATSKSPPELIQRFSGVVWPLREAQVTPVPAPFEEEMPSPVPSTMSPMSVCNSRSPTDPVPAPE